MTKRIAVIGISGSGKSHFGRDLAAASGLPLFHTDRLWWRGNWQEVAEKDYLEEHRRWVDGERWIIEGFVDPAMANRLERAECIVYLDCSGSRAAWQVLRRWWQHRRRARPELPPEALERLQPAFLWRVLWRQERPLIELALAGIDPRKVTRVTTRGEQAGVLAACRSAGLY